MNPTLSSLLPPVQRMARMAGKAILALHQHPSLSVEAKFDGTPVTHADHLSHQLLCEALSQLTPEIPILSEEDPLRAPTETPSPPLYWCIDPLDGTREFIHGTHGEFAVNIGLIQEGHPVLGVVYAPALEELFFASRHEGAFWQYKDLPPVRLQTRTCPLEEAQLLVSRTYRPEKIEILQQKWNLQVIPMSSSLKSCRIAQGKGDLYLCKGPTGPWDTAAPQCILEEAGGGLYGLPQQTPLDYKMGRLQNPSFLACGDPEFLYGTLSSIISHFTR
jgi:3'(2'), 5'-bisphosphate nucleotidase